MYLMMRDGRNEVNIAFLKGRVLKFVAYIGDWTKCVIVGIDFFGRRA